MIYNIALKAYIVGTLSVTGLRFLNRSLGTITLVVIKADEITSRQRRGYEKLEKFAKKHRLTPQIQVDLKVDPKNDVPVDDGFVAELSQISLLASTDSRF